VDGERTRESPFLLDQDSGGAEPVVLSATVSALGFSSNPKLGHGFMVQNPLRIGQLDAVFLESPSHTHENLTPDSPETILRIVDPDLQLKIDGIFPKTPVEMVRESKCDPQE
jgi:hypothetical protein